MNSGPRSTLYDPARVVAHESYSLASCPDGFLSLLYVMRICVFLFVADTECAAVPAMPVYVPMPSIQMDVALAATYIGMR